LARRPPRHSRQWGCCLRRGPIFRPDFPPAIFQPDSRPDFISPLILAARTWALAAITKMMMWNLEIRGTAMLMIEFWIVRKDEDPL
jgi:hypothetical protein